MFIPFFIFWLESNSHAGEFLGLKVIANEFVEFFGQLKDTTEDKHLTVVNIGTVSTSWGWLERRLWKFNLSEYLGFKIQLPEVIKFVVIIVLPSKNVEFIVMNN